jgi:hypothetical protein
MPRKREVGLKKMVYGAVAAVCLAGAPAHAADQPEAGCSYREDPLAAPSADAATQDKHRVTLLAVTPAEGAEVRANSVLEIDVEYHVAGFAADKFFLMVRFPTASLGSMTPGETPDYRYLKAPSGKVHLCVPLAEAYEHPGVRWPLSFVVSINEKYPGHSRPVVDSRTAQLNSVDVPASALARKEQVPPEDVQRALMTVFGYIEQQGAMNKLCPARFAEFRSRYNKTYRAWELRNAEAIRQIHEQQFDLLRSTTSSPAAAAMAFDATRNAAFSFLGALKESELRWQCEATMELMNGATGDLATATATAVNLGIVRKYLASQKKREVAK